MLCSGQTLRQSGDMMREVALIAGLALVMAIGYSWLNSARAAPPSVGQAAPAFRLQDQNGNWIALEDFKGKWVALYFYPKADTPGCTKEACEFRDLFPRFKKSKAVILGVSPDPVKSHVKFKTKYDLPFTLLADELHEVCELYGVWKEKSMYGRKYMGVERSTFLIDATGKLAKAWIKLTPKGHAEDVAAAIAELATP